MPVELEPKAVVFKQLDRPRMCLLCGGLFDEMVRLIRDDGMECWLCEACFNMPLIRFMPMDHPDAKALKIRDA
jgi:hypothetical protein